MPVSLPRISLFVTRTPVESLTWMLRHGRVTDPSAESEPVVATQRSGDGGGTFVRGGVSVAAVAFVGLGRAVDGSTTCGTNPEDPGEAPSPATDGDPSPGPPLSGASPPAFASAPGSSAGRGLSSAGNPAAAVTPKRMASDAAAS